MSKSKLEEYTYQKLKSEYPHLKIKQNSRPIWMRYKDGTRLELDLYIPYLNIAIEIQGEQHYRFVEFFHRSKEKFNKQLEYGEYKKFICRARGITLFEVSSKNDVRVTMLNIKSLAPNPSKALKFYTKKGFKKWRHREIKFFLRRVSKGKYQSAIDRFHKLNSIMIFNKQPPLSINDIRIYKKAFFDTPEKLLGKHWSKNVSLKIFKRIRGIN